MANNELNPSDPTVGALLHKLDRWPQGVLRQDAEINYIEVMELYFYFMHENKINFIDVSEIFYCEILTCDIMQEDE